MSRSRALEHAGGMDGMRSRALVLLCVGLWFAPSGCASPRGAEVAKTPVPPIPALSPEPPPGWIASLSPRGQAQEGAQIRVRFSDDVVPVEALETPDKQAALAHFSIAPVLPARSVALGHP